MREAFMLSAGWRNGYLRGTDHNQCQQIYVKKMLDINRKSPKYIYKKTEQLKDNFIPNLGFSIPSLGIEKPKFGTDIPRGGIESGKGEGSEGRNSNRAGTWRQELMQRPWMSAAYWFDFHGLLSLFCYRTQDHQPRVAGPSNVNH